MDVLFYLKRFIMGKKLKSKRHQGRDDLVGEYPWGDIGQIIFLMLFLIVWIADSFLFNYSTFLADAVANYVKIPLALFFLFCSGYFARSGLRIIFGAVREQPTVIRKGVFSLVRHPIYLGSILFYLGLICVTFSLLSVLVWSLIVIFYQWIALYEEKLLRQRFGLEYERYRREVPMWIPKISGKKMEARQNLVEGKHIGESA